MTGGSRRRRSQMDLALAAGVSPRHLSFVETGRSRASPELLLALADHLDVPLLRTCNTLLLAGGICATLRTDVARIAGDGPAVRNTLQTILLSVMTPIRGVVIDRYWNVCSWPTRLPSSWSTIFLTTSWGHP